MLIVDCYVFLVDLYGQVLIFYLKNFMWTQCSVEKNNNQHETYTRDSDLKGSIVECEGEIIHVPEWQHYVDRDTRQRMYFDFYRLNRRKTTWQKMSTGNLRGMSWFLQDEGGYNSFVLKNTAMRKVYNSCICSLIQGIIL